MMIATSQEKPLRLLVAFEQMTHVISFCYVIIISSQTPNTNITADLIQRKLIAAIGKWVRHLYKQLDSSQCDHRLLSPKEKLSLIHTILYPLREAYAQISEEKTHLPILESCLPELEYAETIFLHYIDHLPQYIESTMDAVTFKLKLSAFTEFAGR